MRFTSPMQISVPAVGVIGLSVAAMGGGKMLPIANPSFEQLSRPLAVGEQTNGMGGAGVQVATRFPFINNVNVSWSNPVEAPGWRTFVQPPPSTAIIRVGVLNPPDRQPGVPFMTGQDGSYLLAIQNAFLSQTLPVQLEPDTRYVMRFLGGIGWLDSDYFLPVALLATADTQTIARLNNPGVITLTIDNDNRPTPEQFGTMNPYVLRYTSPRTLPPGLVGKYLAINLLGSDGFPRVCYDNISLEARPGPCHFDLDADGAVGFVDFTNLAAALGTPSGATLLQGDTDEDGDVDLADFAALQESYGAGCL